ncbi:MAG: TetR/AcrR family transcriptional regulator [Methylobacterium mesophilicum]|nr:TetR/AcrR family transcriptional regulator [Methylobacterium mesophilicum]
MKSDTRHRPTSPQRERGLARIAAIRDAAARLFLERGFERVTLDDIAHAAGGSKSTLYANFRDKPKMFEAAMETAIDAFKRDWPFPSIVTKGALNECLEDTATQTYSVLASDQGLALYRLAFTEGVQFPLFRRAWSEIAEDKPLTLFASTLSFHGANMSLAGLFYAIVIAGPIQKALLGRPLSVSEFNNRTSEAACMIAQAAGHGCQSANVTSETA